MERRTSAKFLKRIAELEEKSNHQEAQFKLCQAKADKALLKVESNEKETSKLDNDIRDINKILKDLQGATKAQDVLTKSGAQKKLTDLTTDSNNLKTKVTNIEVQLQGIDSERVNKAHLRIDELEGKFKTVQSKTEELDTAQKKSFLHPEVINRIEKAEKARLDLKTQITTLDNKISSNLEDLRNYRSLTDPALNDLVKLNKLYSDIKDKIDEPHCLDILQMDNIDELQASIVKQIRGEVASKFNLLEESNNRLTTLILSACKAEADPTSNEEIRKLCSEIYQRKNQSKPENKGQANKEQPDGRKGEQTLLIITHEGNFFKISLQELWDCDGKLMNYLDAVNSKNKANSQRCIPPNDEEICIKILRGKKMLREWAMYKLEDIEYHEGNIIDIKELTYITHSKQKKAAANLKTGPGKSQAASGQKKKDSERAQTKSSKGSEDGTKTAKQG